MTPRVLIHVQHLLGTGHLRRALAIALALARDGFEVELLSGGMAVPGLDSGGIVFTQLPPARAADARFTTLLDESGRSIDEAWRARRREATLARFAAFRPHVLVTELFPFGRRMMSFEMMALVQAARARSGTRIACSLRDILAPKANAARIDEIIERVMTFYDGVLVHGDRALIPLDASFPAVDRLGDRLVHTGYVEGPRGPEPPPGDGEDEVIVSIGGGRVGARLVEAASEARGLGAGDRRTWRILLGADLPEEARAKLAPAPGLIIERARPDFSGLLARCAVSVSQCGYNTALDVLNARARAVFVPFAGEGEREQTLRAEAWAARGWAEIVPEDALTGAALAAAIDRASRAPRPDAGWVQRGGAEATVGWLRRQVAL